MNHLELLKKMMQRDSSAFLEMTEQYSWSVYSKIRESVTDPDQTDRLFHMSMDGFYRGLYESRTEDPVEALLLMYTDMVLQEEREKTGVLRPQKNSITQEKGSVFSGLLTALLLGAIAVTIWIIAGLLMDMNLLPFFDAGYSWFNTNCIHLF